MGDIILTTGNGFDGYEIEEYLGFVNGQIALSSNFFKELSSNLAEWTTQESTAITSKLENSSENAVQNLVKAAKEKGANGIIGVELSYTGFSNNAIGTVASGTAVKIRKKKEKRKTVTAKLYVSNYYNMLMPRPVKVTLTGDANGVKISPLFYNYNQDEIQAVRCDIELTNFYEEKLLLQGIDFVFGKNNVTQLKAESVECKLLERAIPLIKDVKVYVKKYVTTKGIFVPDGESIDITMSKRALEGLKEKRGIDAVERYRSNETTWLCNCGYINAVGDATCKMCGRKEEELKYNVGFDYEGMCNRMKGMPNVSAMKDILVDYIKQGAIDAKYRMELLEIMESGLQYEKTRGDMTETVLEKVIKVFED